MGAPMAGLPLPFLENADRLKATTAEEASPLVLVLGGSTFMGRATLDALLQVRARICVVNRGRFYWGTKDPSNGRVARVTADRRDKQSFAERIDAVTSRAVQNEPSRAWSLVADFSAYDGNDINAALEGLRGRFHLYAYISSDSVYEVSKLAGEGWQSGVTHVSEGSSARPTEAEMRKKLRKADGYGDGKLEAEEALCAGISCLSAEHPIRAIALRLPDVLGPYDDTFRLWAYWHWWHSGPENRPQVKKQTLKRSSPDSHPGADPADPPLAFVFSHDVARFLVHLITQVPDLPAANQSHFDAVNLGCDLQIPMRNFLELLAQASGLHGVSPACVERPKGFLPSVDRPLPLDFKKLKETYLFSATPLEEVLKVCADWFSDACKHFPEEAAEAAMKLPPSARAPALAYAGLEMPQSPSSDSSSS
ncbi:unnamed protein product [Cladocopium goreaui]|uniref:SelT-like protein C35C5.3 n=2 Tax=Cladocopium goreaui TaxID=2562237 RepID=A0A9P1GFG4_9DINO|nr:unnamed protein product [Cladocopium goreaui]